MNEFTQHDIEAIQKKTKLLQKMTDLILNDILTLYKSGQYIELNSDEKRWQPTSDKIPVWLIWWQGADAMPELVKACYASLQKSLSENLCEIHLITHDNVDEYISLPAWVIEKFNADIIDITHLSDIIRMALLDDYGGLYLDATFYLTAGIPDDFFMEKEFFTLCDRKKDWKDLVQGRWSCNFFYKRVMQYGGTSYAGHLFFKYIKNAFYYYWASQGKINDYYLFDYIIDGAYRHFPEIQSLLDSVPDTNPQVADLVFALNDVYSPETFRAFTRNTGIFKLSNKIPLTTKSASKDTTIYGHIVEKNTILC